VNGAARPRRLAYGGWLRLLAISAALAVWPSHALAATSSSQIVAKLNAERQHNSIPGDLTEDTSWSSKCAAHNTWYEQNKNSSDPHHPPPGSPGYSADAAWAGSHSVLAYGSFWADGNPWETAPFHLLQMLSPRLTKTGAHENTAGFNCLVTLGDGSTDRSSPGVDTLYGWPGPGRADGLWYEEAHESPSVPGDSVGLPEGTTTGPNIMVYWDGPGPKLLYLTAGKVTGPGGVVQSKILNAPIGDDAAGFIIPVAPLQPSATYTVQATFATDQTASPADKFTGSYSFKTEPKKPSASLIHISSGGIAPYNGNQMLSVPIGIDDPMDGKPGKIQYAYDGATPQDFSNISTLDDGTTLYFSPPSSGHFMRVFVKSDSFQIGSTTYEAAEVCRQFSSSGAISPCPGGPGQDSDSDGKPDSSDNCPLVPNAGQVNSDLLDGGDACDPDDDNDGLSDAKEAQLGTKRLDVDSDDDGLSDASEDKNHNGHRDSGETKPTKFDTDGDKLSDGLERGVTKPIADPPGAIVATATSTFRKDKNPKTKTSALKKDTDKDGLSDGTEDKNRNGRRDSGETNPLKKDTDGDGFSDKSDKKPLDKHRH
jgi:thrombospondin type 3 repeat protein